MSPAPPNEPDALPHRLRVVAVWMLRSVRLGIRVAGFVLACVIAMFAIVLASGNILFGSARDVPYRALDPGSPVCRKALETDTEILARRDVKGLPGGIGNDEWAALDVLSATQRPRFSCTLQHHTIPNYTPEKRAPRDIGYDLAFIEFQEDGKPYQTRVQCIAPPSCIGAACQVDEACRDEGYGPVKNGPLSQLQAVRDHLDPKRPNYVIVFVHGWRHNAEIGDPNIGDLRHYAAHVARFVEDRYEDDNPAKPKVTAIYVGWRGARTDETWLRRYLGGSRIGANWINDSLWTIAEWIGTISALPTLFDRKPVSEAIAPAALSALRDIERRLDIAAPLAGPDALPVLKLNRMIVFGHSLGGNMLATALRDDLRKKVERHRSGSYVLPPLGDLVVLINPASEASKWTEIQRAVWIRTPMSASERASADEYEQGQRFFRPEQRPVVVSVTAARDWPPGGRTEVDCAVGNAEIKTSLDRSRDLVRDSVAYDWATYDLFPAFKFDFRPIADTFTRWGSGRDPHDRCAPRIERSWFRRALGWTGVVTGRVLRVLPFMRTDTEETHTIGHLDPIRAAQGGLQRYAFAARPFGTTHELRGPLAAMRRTQRKPCDAVRYPECAVRPRETPINYVDVTKPEADCPLARNWLGLARAYQKTGHGMNWVSDSAADQAPALRFLHGFYVAGIAPITRANDPFWNMRAFDTALARHDGYMLSSFICAMNQLVMDDITDFSPHDTPAPARAPITAPVSPAAP